MRKPFLIPRKSRTAPGNAHQALPGQIYLVTFATHERNARFLDHRMARIAVQSLLDPRLWTDSKLLAWILMPDCWHGLIELGKFDRLPIRVQQLKSNAARKLRAAYPDIEKLWEKGFHDRPLQRADSIETAASE